METSNKITLGREISEKLVREKKFKTIDPTNGQDDGMEAFKKFTSDTYMGFYNWEDEGKFLFGWRTFEEDEDSLRSYPRIKESR